MKTILNFFSIFILIIILSCKDASDNIETFEQPTVVFNEDEIVKPSFDFEKTKNKAKEALSFCQNKKFNTEFCVLIDFSLHSGINRFFVWDFKKDTPSHQFLVSHGCGDNPWNYDYSKENPSFSNTEGSHCSSLGKYKIGKRANSDWGIKVKYFLHGLESTNKNAYSRTIVFHSWLQVADEEVYPNGTPEGWGCPAISNKNMEIMDALLKNTNLPVLMWIYC